MAKNTKKELGTNKIKESTSVKLSLKQYRLYRI